MTRRQIRSSLALGLLIGLVAAHQVLWSLTDRFPPAHRDSYPYLTNLLRLLDQLARGHWDISAALRDLALMGRPPLYQLMTAPFVLLFGRSEAAALSVNVVFIAVLGIATYNLGRLVKNRTAGLLAAFLVLTYPPVVQLSRMYLPHFASCAWAALSLWLLLEVVERRSIATAWLWGLSLAVGLLNHPYFAWTLLGPTLAAGGYMVLYPADSQGISPRRGRAWWAGAFRDRFVRLGLLPAALLALGPSLLWYLAAGLPAFHQMRRLSELDVFIGSFHEIETGAWWYALSTPGVMSYVLAAALVVGLITSVARPRRATTLLCVTLTTGYVFYSAMPIRAWWYAASLLPAAAVLSSAWIVDLRNRRLAGGLVAVTLLTGSFNYFLVTWGEAHAWVRPVARALGSPISDQKTCADRRTLALCPDRARPQPWPWEEVVALMLADPDCDSERRCHLLIANLPGAGEHMVQYLAMRDGHGDRIVARQLNASKPYAFDALLLSDFIAYTDGPRHSKHLRATSEFLTDPPREFSDARRELTTFELPAPFHRSVKLVQRIEALSVEEVEASKAAFDLPEEYADQTRAALSVAYAAAGEVEKALQVYGGIPSSRTRAANRSFLIRELMALAERRERDGSRARAIAAYEAVLQLRPRHVRGRERLRELRRLETVGP